MAKRALEFSNLKQVGLAVQMYGDDFEGRVVGANDGRQHDVWSVRKRLFPSYLPYSGSKDPEDQEIWGCPSVARFSWKTRYSWFWNVGWGGALDEDGNGINCDKTGAGWGVDDYTVYLNGKGYSTKKSPESIVLITDSGGGHYTNPKNFPNHDLNTGKPQGSSSLYLSGRANWRPTSKLNSCWNGGANVWR